MWRSLCSSRLRSWPYFILDFLSCNTSAELNESLDHSWSSEARRSAFRLCVCLSVSRLTAKRQDSLSWFLLERSLLLGQAMCVFGFFHFYPFSKIKWNCTVTLSVSLFKIMKFIVSKQSPSLKWFLNILHYVINSINLSFVSSQPGKTYFTLNKNKLILC